MRKKAVLGVQKKDIVQSIASLKLLNRWIYVLEDVLNSQRRPDLEVKNIAYARGISESELLQGKLLVSKVHEILEDLLEQRRIDPNFDMSSELNIMFCALSMRNSDDR